MRVALYIRTGNVNDLEGLKKQRNELLLYTKENNLIITKVYEDVGTDRTNYNLMISDSNQYEAILVTHVSRISRKYKEILEFFSIIEQTNTKWITTNEMYNSVTAQGRLCTNIMLSVVESFEMGEGL